MRRESILGVRLGDLSPCEDRHVVFLNAQVDVGNHSLSVGLFAGWSHVTSLLCRRYLHFNGNIYPLRLLDTHLAVRFPDLLDEEQNVPLPTIYVMLDHYTGMTMRVGGGCVCSSLSLSLSLSLCLPLLGRLVTCCDSTLHACYRRRRAREDNIN
jgi:hypothetical protein